MIRAEGLRKAFGETVALDGVDLEVPAGAVHGLLGPNGAGKTTTVRILTTLLAPDAGSATVAGFDVQRQAAQLREVIGLAGQFAAIDPNLTGRENLEMVGRLYHLPRAAVAPRSSELLERFGLADAASRPARGYSGGMRRRLDLAASLLAAPKVLFLDEPTTGLDPRSRQSMWDVIRELVAEGTTLLLTTQYLEEADVLADRISVIDTGRVIAHGTADELKDRIGGDRVDVRIADRDDLDRAARALAPLAAGEPALDVAEARVSVPVAAGSAQLAEAVRLLDAAGIEISDLSLRRPTLDDVFLALTGQRAESAPAEEPAPAGRRGRRRARSAA